MMRLRFISRSPEASANKLIEIVKAKVLKNIRKCNVAMMSSTTPSAPTPQGLQIPVYNINKPQTLEKRKARLHHQSRKRGMLENDLLLSTFAKKYLDSFNEEQTLMYDRLINSPSNDWDIYYWIVQKEVTPKEFDNEVMELLKEHAKNKDRKVLSMPDLH